MQKQDSSIVVREKFNYIFHQSWCRRLIDSKYSILHKFRDKIHLRGYIFPIFISKTSLNYDAVLHQIKWNVDEQNLIYSLYSDIISLVCE